jgi:hypothetical protein
MDLKMVIAQELNINFISFNEELYSIIYSKGEYCVIFRENATSTDSISRWDMILRHKDNLSQFLMKDDPANQVFPSSDEFTEEKFLNGVKKMNTFFDQAGIMENDIIIGYAEVTSISKEKSQFILYLKEVINESFAEPTYKAISNYIAPTRDVRNRIDPKIVKQIKGLPKDTQQKVSKKKSAIPKIEKKEEKKSENNLPAAKPQTTLSPQPPKIEPYEIEGEKPCHRPIIDSWNRGFSAKEISVQLSINKSIKMNDLSVHNELSFLRKQLGEEIVPLNRNRPKKMSK